MYTFVVSLFIWKADCIHLLWLCIH